MAETNLGRYQLQQEIYSDKTGTYYRAYDQALHHKVNIKVLSAQLVQNKEFIEKYHQKTKVISKLYHPNILRIYSFQQQDDKYYLVAEYLPGRNLKELLLEQALETNKALNYFIMIARAVDYAHGYGILHLSVSPKNILISPDNQIIKVANFGVQYMETQPESMLSGEILEHFYYFSPEQFEKKELTQSSDIYSLGVLLYQMLTGKLPFIAETVDELKRKHLEEQPVLLENYNPQIPENISNAVLKSLAKDPKERHLNVREFLEQLGVPDLPPETFKINISPTQANWHQNKAQELIKLGQFEPAFGNLEKAIQYDPYNPSWYYNLAEVYYKTNKTEQAAESLKKAINLQPDHSNFHFKLANIFFQLNKLESAINEYLIVIALDPKNYSAYHFLGICYFKLNNLGEAEKSWKKLLEVYPNTPQAGENKSTEGEESATQTEDTTPTNVGAVVYNLGVLSCFKQQKDNAKILWEKSVSINPNYAPSWYNLGILELERGNTERALHFWQKTLEVNPNFTEALYILGNLWYLKNELVKANEQWKKAVSANPKFWQVFYNLGVSAFRTGDYFSACDCWKKVINLNLNFTSAYRNLALVYQYKLNKPEEALSMWEKVVSLDPEDKSAYYNLGEIYLVEGKTDLAFLAWEKVLKSQLVYSWQFYHNLGVLYYKKDNLNLAKDCWSTALALRLFNWEKDYANV